MRITTQTTKEASDDERSSALFNDNGLWGEQGW